MKHRYKIEVELGGLNRTLSFSNNMWYLFHEKQGKDFNQTLTLFTDKSKAGSVEQNEMIVDIIESALEANDREHKEVPEYDRFILRSWIDGLDPTQINDIVKMLFLSKGIDLDKLDEIVKKKVSPQKSQKKENLSWFSRIFGKET